MDERQLRILRELGELGSVAAVAEALLVTPSAVSQQLRLLQRGVPVALTERTGRRLTLTAAGQALAEAAIEVETALARARQVVDEYVAEPDGKVSVSGFHSAALVFFPRLLRALAEPGSPRLALADQDVAQDQFPRLTRDYDLVLAHRFDHAPPWPRTIATTTLLHEPLDIALPVGHRLAAKKRLTPADVAAEPWVSVHPGFAVLPLVEAIGAACGRPLDVVHRVNEFTVVAELVAAGGGIALLPRWTTLRHFGVVLRPLSGVRARRDVDVLCRPEALGRRAVRTVLTEMRQAAKAIRVGGEA